MVLHIETGSATFGDVRSRLESLHYTLVRPHGNGPVHRFTRDNEHVDVMVADHLAPAWKPTAYGKPVFAVPGGTSALRKTVNCDIEFDNDSVRFSVPDALGALVLKGAAYQEDPRDRHRHLDDAAVLACAIDNPLRERQRMQGSDRKRIRILAEQLKNTEHGSPFRINTGAEHNKHYNCSYTILQAPPTPRCNGSVPETGKPSNTPISVGVPTTRAAPSAIQDRDTNR
ncbi:hypothetical protein LQ384_26255 [Rhodococcus rhodochrous]|uniref:Uncharacterized protein n=1 Tax=Rhodococcus rhodochrous TaxID=1829 RepID=A0AAW4XP98_RHORH|nr:hypothetical protein [Rhodococcus rhodochrous]MCD2114609.1 hypothetical protein [Rhodococcus rhodochrous]